MTRAAAHVDAHYCTPRVRRPRATRDEHDVRRVAVDVSGEPYVDLEREAEALLMRE